MSSARANGARPLSERRRGVLAVPYPALRRFELVRMLRGRSQRIAWTSMVLGAATGLVLGLWSFDGPLSEPAWLGAYDDTPRRLARLGHVAFFGLALVNLQLARSLHELGLCAAALRVTATAMNLGNVLLPITLFAAAVFPAAKYLLPLPALSICVALAMAAFGFWAKRNST